MVTYLAMQILKGKISYAQTVEKFPQYKHLCPLYENECFLCSIA